MKIVTINSLKRFLNNISNLFVNKKQYEVDMANINSYLQDINNGLDEIIGE